MRKSEITVIHKSNDLEHKAQKIHSKQIISHREPFMFGNSPLEDVDGFNYHGVSLNHNNDISSIINNRVLKASRIIHMLMQRLSHNISPLVSLTLFDKHIVPILYYGAAIWSAPNTNNYSYLNHNNGAEPEILLLKRYVTPVVMKFHMHLLGKWVNVHRILPNLHYIIDKEKLLRGRLEIFNNCHYKRENRDKKNTHQHLCKRSSNISIYASNTPVGNGWISDYT